MILNQNFEDLLESNPSFHMQNGHILLLQQSLQKPKQFHSSCKLFWNLKKLHILKCIQLPFSSFSK